MTPQANIIHTGDCREILKTFPDESIDCVITSPPYWAVRNYGTKTIFGGNPFCDHRLNKNNFCIECGAWLGELGQEYKPSLYVEHLIPIFIEIFRVLRTSGTLFVNIADTYSSGSRAKGGGDRNSYDPKNPNVNRSDFAPNRMGCGIPDKSLCLIPERFAIEMVSRGWILRNTIIWHKPNQMPQSATDRFTVDFEKIFFFVKKPNYFFEQQLEPAIGYDGRKEINYNGGNKDVSIGKHVRWKKHKNTQEKGQQPNSMHIKREMGVADENYFERNVRTVWSINTEPFSEAHFATYPQRLVERMIKAGCPENGVVLDPFFGSGTTGVYARKVNRDFIGIELNPAYVTIAQNRLQKELGLFYSGNLKEETT